MQDINTIEAKRVAVSTRLLNSLAVVDGETVMYYNGLRFSQVATDVWQDEIEGVQMRLSRVVDVCIADDHRLAVVDTRASMAELANDLNRLLNSPAVGVQSFVWRFYTNVEKTLDVVDTARGILAVRTGPMEPPVDFMFYHTSLETLGSDNRPSEDYGRLTIGERMLDVRPVWPGKDRKIALCVDKKVFTFYPDEDDRLSVIVTEFDGTVLCRISAH